nr:MAG TPA: YopX protein [Caudoviricetes sp.]
MKQKFRAWDTTNKEMFKDTFAITESGQVVVVDQSSVFVSPDYVFVDNLVIMQSTGLKDKNGKEIFEGDVVQFEDCSEASHFLYINTGIIEWCQGGFHVTNRDSVLMGDLLDGDVLDVKIIGNIYENPALLEDKE